MRKLNKIVKIYTKCPCNKMFLSSKCAVCKINQPLYNNPHINNITICNALRDIEFQFEDGTNG